MDKHTQENLLYRYLRNECSGKEEKQARQILMEADADKTLNGLLDVSWESLQLYPDLPSGQSEEIYKKIRSQLDADPQAVAGRIIKSPNRRSWAWPVAASLTSLLMVAGIIYRVFFYQTQIMEETGFGEIASITLPDKSVVKLNGNSRIRYSPGWSSTEARQVWVEGEAFFSVVHTANDQKFIVHTSDREAVEVLGTTFTVTKRKSGTRVVLNTGKVRFQVSRQGQRRTIILKPGDLVQVKGNSTQVEKRSVDPAAYSSWVHQKMVFDNTPLVEVLTMLEETYGLQVVVGDRDIYSKKVSGSTPVTNINLLLAGLERSLGLKITRNGNKVLIEKKLIDQ